MAIQGPSSNAANHPVTAATLAAIRRFGKRMEVTVPQEPALNGLYTLRVLIQSPPELAAKYAYLGLAQGLTNERQVVQVLILPPSRAGGLPEVLYRPVYPTTDRQIAELFARNHVAQAMLADQRQRRLDAIARNGDPDLVSSLEAVVLSATAPREGTEPDQ
jgi:hypothetical protein